MGNETAAPVRLHLQGSSYVRVTEDLDEAVARISNAACVDGWAWFSDPGSGEIIVVRADLVQWMESESNDG